jgi:hypothetical protein
MLTRTLAANGDVFNVSYAMGQLKAVLALCAFVVAIAMVRHALKGRVSAIVGILACLMVVGWTAYGNPLGWGAAVGSKLFG